MTLPAPVLLDTDTLSAVLRRNPLVTQPVHEYLRLHRRLSFSMITRYEILRGLKARGATGQQRAFESFRATNSVLSLTDAVVVRAADIYANLHQRGELIGDADILIAATAMVEERTLVTNNRRHFDRVEDLRVENWLEDNNGEETL